MPVDGVALESKHCNCNTLVKERQIDQSLHSNKEQIIHRYYIVINEKCLFVCVKMYQT